jgi:flagellar hook-associated protein 2
LRSPLLRSLKGGQGITEGVLTLTDRTGATANVSLAGAETLDDVLTALNASGLDITASVNEARTGIVLRDTSGATSSNLIVANGDANNVATQLGLVVNAAVTEIDGGTLDLQTLSEATLLSELPFSSSTPSGSFTVTDSSGATGAVNLTTLAATTLGDVIDAINDLGIGVAARINNTGDGLLLTDTAGGSGVLTVNDSGSGTAAAQLNIAGEATGTTLDGAFSKTITLSAEDTLADLVEQINAISGGLTASLINDGSTGLPVRISLASSIAGARGNFTIDDGGLGLGIEEVVEGRDALLALGAGATLLASSSNSFTDVVSGLNVSLKEASTQAVTITVATDSASIRGRVSAFVDQYNRFRDKLETYDFFNETDGSKGILFGTTEALRLSSDLSNAISRRYFASSEISYFTALGVSFTDDGNLEFDAAQFDEVYAGNPAAVEAFFTDAEKGFSEEIDRVAESLAGIDNSALISSAFTLQDKASILQERIDFLDARLERTEERLLLQFYNLELAVSKLQNTFGSIQSALTNATNFFNSVSR